MRIVSLFILVTGDYGAYWSAMGAAHQKHSCAQLLTTAETSWNPSSEVLIDFRGSMIPTIWLPLLKGSAHFSTCSCFNHDRKFCLVSCRSCTCLAMYLVAWWSHDQDSVNSLSDRLEVPPVWHFGWVDSSVHLADLFSKLCFESVQLDGAKHWWSGWPDLAELPKLAVTGWHRQTCNTSSSGNTLTLALGTRHGRPCHCQEEEGCGVRYQEAHAVPHHSLAMSCRDEYTLENATRLADAEYQTSD